MVDERYVKKCPECSGINLFFNKDKGEIICKDCGRLLEYITILKQDSTTLGD